MKTLRFSSSSASLITSFGVTGIRVVVRCFFLIFSTLLEGTSAVFSSVDHIHINPGTGGHARHSFMSSDRSEISPDWGLTFGGHSGGWKKLLGVFVLRAPVVVLTRVFLRVDLHGGAADVMVAAESSESLLALLPRLIPHSCRPFFCLLRPRLLGLSRPLFFFRAVSPEGNISTSS